MNCRKFKIVKNGKVVGEVIVPIEEPKSNSVVGIAKVIQRPSTRCEFIKIFFNKDVAPTSKLVNFQYTIRTTPKRSDNSLLNFNYRDATVDVQTNSAVVEVVLDRHEHRSLHNASVISTEPSPFVSMINISGIIALAYTTDNGTQIWYGAYDPINNSWITESYGVVGPLSNISAGRANILCYNPPDGANPNEIPNSIFGVYNIGISIGKLTGTAPGGLFLSQAESGVFAAQDPVAEKLVLGSVVDGNISGYPANIHQNVGRYCQLFQICQDRYAVVYYNADSESIDFITFHGTPTEHTNVSKPVSLVSNISPINSMSATLADGFIYVAYVSADNLIAFSFNPLEECVPQVVSVDYQNSINQCVITSDSCGIVYIFTIGFVEDCDTLKTYTLSVSGKFITSISSYSIGNVNADYQIAAASAGDLTLVVYTDRNNNLVSSRVSGIEYEIHYQATPITQ